MRPALANARARAASAERIAARSSARVRDSVGALFGGTEYSRFVVVSTARTGSNYLLAGLARAPSVRTYAEIFADHNRKPGVGFDRPFAILCRRQPRWVRTVGFKLFYHHLSEDEWARFLTYDDFDVVHLLRRDRLRTLVSRDIAKHTNRWTSTGRAGSLVPRRIVLETGDLVERLERIERFEQLARRRLAGRRVLEMHYEELTADPATKFDAIAAFLGITDMPQREIHLRRQNPEPLNALVANFDEIVELLAPTRFTSYVSESRSL